jgi:glyoxylase-like metal-dependent hydrolase (beta-lactamase superfamily II)
MPEILPGVHQVEGVDPSPNFTTHVYVVKDRGPTYTLIDTGLPGAADAICAYLAKVGIPLASIRQILLTHLHLDHTGSLKEMIERTKARTFAHWIEAGYIAKDPPYKGPGSPPQEPVTVDETLKDGDRLDAGGGLIAYHTPGHTPGHLSFYQPERRLLFSGDLFFVMDGKPGLTPKEYTFDRTLAVQSARRMSQLSIDSLLTYHGGPVLRDGGSAIRGLGRLE